MKQGITLGIHPALLPRQPSDCNDEQFIFRLQHCQQMRGATGEVGCSPHPSRNQIRASEEGDTRDCSHLPSYPGTVKFLHSRSWANSARLLSWCLLPWCSPRGRCAKQMPTIDYIFPSQPLNRLWEPPHRWISVIPKQEKPHEEQLENPNQSPSLHT